jgi:hypothetical protein
MKNLTIVAIVLSAVTPCAAMVRERVTPQELATAINKADALLVPYRTKKMSSSDVRTVRCIASDEEPTEFQCKWQQRINGHWVNGQHGSLSTETAGA